MPFRLVAVQLCFKTMKRQHSTFALSSSFTTKQLSSFKVGIDSRFLVRNFTDFQMFVYNIVATKLLSFMI